MGRAGVRRAFGPSSSETQEKRNGWPKRSVDVEKHCRLVVCSVLGKENGIFRQMLQGMGKARKTWGNGPGGRGDFPPHLPRMLTTNACSGYDFHCTFFDF